MDSLSDSPLVGQGDSGLVDTGLLRARLHHLQCMGWRRMHVVWPRLCLGSSHCNIQYNGMLNFVGQAVVAHVCQHLLEVEQISL
jgi:hypothetical protein